MWGGYIQDKSKLLDIEVFDTKTMKWEVLNWHIPFPIQGASIFYKNPNEIMVIGGK